LRPQVSVGHLGVGALGFSATRGGIRESRQGSVFAALARLRAGFASGAFFRGRWFPRPGGIRDSKPDWGRRGIHRAKMPK
jgi:hypothetical protein